MTAAVTNPDAVQTPVAPEPVAAAAPEPVAAQEPKPDIIGAAPEGEVTPEPVTPQLDADGRMRGPDGKFIAAEPKAGDPAPAPAAAAAPVAPVVPPKAADPVNDPIPDTVKAATRERMTALIETVKTKDTEVAAAREDFELIMNPVREAGATPDQFRESMNLLKLINSPIAADQHQALAYLQGASKAMAERLGVVPAGVDPLDGFEDLQLEVRKNPTLRQWAEEAAAGRRLRAATQRQNEEQQQRSQDTAAQQKAQQAGQAAVRSVESALEASDPQYKAKVAVLRADAGFIGGLKALPPTQWAAAFAQKYATIKVAPPAATAPAAPSAPSPLRAKQPAGQNGRLPATSREAVAAAIAAVGA